MEKHLFTSESVTEGHPDKMCDQISDAILDAIISRDKDARVACETAVCTGMVFVMGEISTSCYVDIQSIVRDTVRRHGGWVTAQRREPEGSVFTVGFPCETPEAGGDQM